MTRHYKHGSRCHCLRNPSRHLRGSHVGHNQGIQIIRVNPLACRLPGAQDGSQGLKDNELQGGGGLVLLGAVDRDEDRRRQCKPNENPKVHGSTPPRGQEKNILLKNKQNPQAMITTSSTIIAKYILQKKSSSLIFSLHDLLHTNLLGFMIPSLIFSCVHSQVFIFFIPQVL